MLRLSAALGILGLTVTVASCSLSNEVEPNISFSTTRRDWTATLTDTADASGSLRTVLSTGIILTPNGCYSLRSNMQVRGGVITLTITGSSASSQCPPDQGAYDYSFLASGIDSGTYNFKVIYSVNGRPVTTVLEKSITL